MKISQYIFIAIAMLSVAACSDTKDNFTAGPESVNTKGSAWFKSDYQTTYYYYERPKSNDSIYVYVCRKDCKEALDLPIESTADTTLHIPTSVHFNAGDSVTYLPIASPYIKQTKRENFTLSVPKEYADIYAIRDGVSSISSSILWSEWTPVCDTVLIVSSYKLFPRQGCNLENFQGDKAFRLTNFLGSGNSLIFTLSNKVDTKDLTNNYGSIVPLERYYYGSSTSGDVWDWANDGDWTAWTPQGGTFEIRYPEFGWGHYYYPTADPYDNLDFRRPTECDTITLNGQKYIYDKNYYLNSSEMIYLYANPSTRSAWDWLYFMFCYKIDE